MDNTTSLTIEGYQALYQQKVDNAANDENVHPLESAMYATMRDVLYGRTIPEALAWVQEGLRQTRLANRDGSQDIPLRILTTTLLDLRRVVDKKDGNTSLYLSYRERLGGGSTEFLGKSTTLNVRAEGIAITLYATDILTFTPNGEIILRSGGHHTVTTSKKINEYLPDGMSMKSESGQWVVLAGEHKYKFAEGLIIPIPMAGNKEKP